MVFKSWALGQGAGQADQRGQRGNAFKWMVVHLGHMQHALVTATTSAAKCPAVLQAGQKLLLDYQNRSENLIAHQAGVASQRCHTCGCS